MKKVNFAPKSSCISSLFSLLFDLIEFIPSRIISKIQKVLCIVIVMHSLGSNIFYFWEMTG